MHNDIVINGVHLSRVSASGLHRHTETVLAALDAEQMPFTVLTGKPEIAALYPDKVRHTPQVLGTPGSRANLQRFLWYQTALPYLLRQQKANLFYSPMPEGMLFPICKQIITVADLIAVLYPEFFPVQKHYFRYVLPRLLRASTAIITISEATKQDVERHYAPIDKPIYVAYPSYDDSIFSPVSPLEAQQVKDKYGLDQFVLFVGEMRPYKNVRRLIEAFARIPVPDLKLAIAGKINTHDPTITQAPAQLGISEKVKFLDYVPDQDLAALYTTARLFVFPSLYEGFGIPLLEAMACGCPVVSSDSSSLPEVAGDAAIYCDPNNVDSIAQSICEVANNQSLRQQLMAVGAERVKKFTYKVSADRVIQICDKVLETTKP